jgi:hypothetical protein
MHSIQERLVSLTVSHFPGTMHMSNRCPACEFDMVTFMMMVSGRHNTGSCGDVNLVHGSPQGGSADIVPVPITTLSAWP